MRFTKMHGLGNDYIYIDCFEQEVENPQTLAVSLSDRHFGPGADGLVLIGPSETADVSMRIFNPDGSEAGMCGNAIRCVGKYCYERGLREKPVLSVETKSGVRTLLLHVQDKIVRDVTVNMGEPVLEPPLIPTAFDGNRVVERPLLIGGKRWLVTCVSMGNPHAVIFCDEIGTLDLKAVGPQFECHEMFPERVNAEFAESGDDGLRMRVWERGTGETLACGTGACAVLVAGVLTGRAKRKETIRLAGGELQIEWNEADNCVYMGGPAAYVYDGFII